VPHPQRVILTGAWPIGVRPCTCATGLALPEAAAIQWTKWLYSDSYLWISMFPALANLVLDLSGLWGRKVFRGRSRPFIHSIHNSHLTARPGFRRLELFFALEVLCSTPAVRSSKTLAASYTTTRPAVDSRMVCGAGPQETVIERGVSATPAGKLRPCRPIDVSLRATTLSIEWWLVQVTSVHSHRDTAGLQSTMDS